MSGPAYRGLYLRFAATMDERANARVHSLTGALLADPLTGVTDLIPGYASLYVEYDGFRVREPKVRRWLDGHAAAEAVSSEGGREIEVPVLYDGDDLLSVAASVGLRPEEVVARHTAVSYRVHAMGFLPGFPFMGEVHQSIRTPRRPEPRKKVPAHSVAIAGSQTGIYPLASPGGWQLLGRSLVSAYDPSREEPFLLRPGDKVRFKSSTGRPPAEPLPVSLLAPEPERPFLQVREPGLLDIVVDSGRLMVGRFGLGRGGPLDPLSASIANALLGNAAGEPLIELNLRGPLLEARARGVAAFAGWGLVPVLNGERLEPFRSFELRRGDLLGFVPTGQGCRGYLAIAGGLAVRSISGSASSDLKGLIGEPLREGNLLGIAEPACSRCGVRPGFSFEPYRRSSPITIIRLLPGPQASEEAIEALVGGECAGVFTVAAADRMALRLHGNGVPGGEVLSEGVPIGAIQVPPGGSPILLLNDRGTLGGYSKPAQIHPSDLHKAGQLTAGARLRFIRTPGARFSGL